MPKFDVKKTFGASVRNLRNLLDLKLPKVDGMEVLKRVKEDARAKMIPVAILTSSKERRDLIESYKPDVNSHIVKPADRSKAGTRKAAERGRSGREC